MNKVVLLSLGLTLLLVPFLVSKYAHKQQALEAAQMKDYHQMWLEWKATNARGRIYKAE